MPSLTTPNTAMPTSKPNYAYTRKPKSPIAAFLWRRRMWIESTFVLSMLEPWEKLLILTIFAVIFTLVIIGIFKYLPYRVATMYGRAMYYLWGQEGADRQAAILWSWFGVGEAKIPSSLEGLLKES